MAPFWQLAFLDPYWAGIDCTPSSAEPMAELVRKDVGSVTSSSWDVKPFSEAPLGGTMPGPCVAVGFAALTPVLAGKAFSPSNASVGKTPEVQNAEPRTTALSPNQTAKADWNVAMASGTSLKSLGSLYAIPGS